MPLRLSLKPQERVIIGGAVVKNGDSRTEIFVENQVPILREPDILSPNAVTTPCERIYLAVQLMYVDQDNETQHRRFYEELARDVVEAAPSTKRFLNEVDGHVGKGEYYQALKSIKALLNYEQELLSRGTQSN
jgi:flagellar protein FlbT